MAEEFKEKSRYKWLKGDNQQLKETGKLIVLSPLELSDTGKYHCEVTCNELENWCSKSDPLTIDIKRELSASKGITSHLLDGICTRLLVTLYYLEWFYIKQFKLLKTNF